MAGEPGQARGRCTPSLSLRQRRKQQPDRVVAHPQELGDPQSRRYCGNQTTTTKYNLLTFIPKSLFEQYRRVANIYFTLVAALSLTDYSPVRPWTTFLPLAIVLGVAMVKEAVEDYKRHRQDVEVNNRAVQVFNDSHGKFETKTWRDVRVGDIIIVHKDEYFPADLLFLSAENEEGICYIETMQLDGETNLKIKKALDETKDVREGTLHTLRVHLKCEAPNSRLYQFTGNLEVQPPLVPVPTTLPMSPASILLRGCSLRNTPRIFGLVIYAGHDTKIFMNSTQPPSKRSSVERSVDYIIFFMFGLLFSMCITGCIYFAWWTATYMPRHWYLDPTNVPREYDSSQPVIVGVTNFITAFILYGYLIPIALYVSIEMVKIMQSLVFIGLDRDMYFADTDTPAVARTSNLNEELGMINTILSDKTGTLTRNVMEFFKCSIGGVSYGAGITEIERNNAERRGLKLDVPDEEADNKYREQYFNFYDARLMGTEWAKQPNRETTMQFFRLLALCHTVIPDGPPDPSEIRYEAESPDEAALVVAAKVFGFFMVRRTNTIITLRERLPEGVQERDYEVLNLLEFNSTRKRMSVIIRTPENKILLYCKGADTVIYERLARDHPLNDSLKDVTLQHMEEYGSAGLRTLCLSYTELDPDFYDEWNERFIEAKLSMVDRAAKVDAVAEQVEKDLRLLGCTAIEDKLQEGVPRTIKLLAEAGIRLWVLTGDKMETAINIGYACSLITDEMTQFQLTGACAEVELLEAQGKLDEATHISAERLESQLRKVKATIEADKREAMDTPYALIIDGKALLYALSPRLRQLFLEVGVQCVAVICCRVSPLQKAQVTALVKSWGDKTLAIGDGANDVGMIQKAHIGVGISGLEGMQAAMASDFTIAQFRFLAPLLLVHGRLSYKRITRMICFFFYKNLLYGSTIFVYNAFALFSGQPIYNDFYMTLFNVVFTAAAPLVIGWFDRDLDKNAGLRFPFLYKEGQQNLYFSLPAIVGWLGTALLHAAVIVITVLLGADSLDSDSRHGHAWSLLRNGLLMFTIVIITVHLQLALVIDQWMWMHHAALWGSIALWFIFLLAFGAFPIRLSTDLHFSLGTVARFPMFWLMIVVIPVACMVPVLFFKAMRRHLRPASYQLLQELLMRATRGEVVDAEAALHVDVGGAPGPAAPSGPAALLREKLDLAARLRRRKETRQHGVPYKGFVPPYNTQSRVFDKEELRKAATHVGYNITSSGDTLGPQSQLHLGAPQQDHSHHSMRSHGHQAGHSQSQQAVPPVSSGSGITLASLMSLGRRHSSTASVQRLRSLPGSTASAALLPGEAAAAARGGGAAGAHSLASLPGGAVHLHEPGSGSCVGTGTPTTASSLAGGGHDAVPPVEGFGGVPNPVLANLERAFSQDPRRHRRTDSKLSSHSISSLAKMLQPDSSEGLDSRGSSRAVSRSPSQQQLDVELCSTSGQHAHAGAAAVAAGAGAAAAAATCGGGGTGGASSSATAATQAGSSGGQQPAAAPTSRLSRPSTLDQPQSSQLPSDAACGDGAAAADDPALLQLFTSALHRPRRGGGCAGGGSAAQLQ